MKKNSRKKLTDLLGYGLIIGVIYVSTVSYIIIWPYGKNNSESKLITIPRLLWQKIIH